MTPIKVILAVSAAFILAACENHGAMAHGDDAMSDAAMMSDDAGAMASDAMMADDTMMSN